MTLRVGLIGLGEVAQLMHLPLLADDPRWQIAAVCDISAELTGAMTARYGAPLATTDPAKVIAADLDAVFILSPDETHAPLLEQAIKAGRHVFVEKPSALTAEALRPIVGLPATGVVFVGYMRRYARPFLDMKRLLPDLGPPRHVRIRDLICEAPFFTGETRRTLRPTDLPPGNGDALRAEGAAQVRQVLPDANPSQMRAYRALTGLGCHSLSAMRDLLGAPRGVISAAERGGTVLSVQLDYGDFLASYEAVITDVPLFDAGIDIIGAHQRLSLSYDTPYVRHLPTTLTLTRLAEDGRARTDVLGPSYADPFRDELDAFHAAITTGAPVRTGLADSLEDLELIAEIARKFSAGAGSREISP